MAVKLRSKPCRATLLALALLGATAVTACLGPLLPGQCTEEERVEFELIEHYGTDAIIPEDDALGGCRAAFTSESDPREVIEHYKIALGATGWDVDRAYTGQVEDESGNEVGQVFDVAANKGPMATTITGTSDGGQAVRWIVLLRRVSQ